MNDVHPHLRHFFGRGGKQRDVFLAALSYAFERWHRQHAAAENDALPATDDVDDALAVLAENEALRDAFLELVTRFEDSVPFVSSRYIAHMRASSAIPALLGHFVALLHNPNNISSDSSGAGASIEREALRDLRSMVGYPPTDVAGHFTGGGTVSNYEALLRARHRTGLWLALGALLHEGTGNQRTLFDLAHMGWPVFDEHLALLERRGFSLADISALNIAEASPWDVNERLADAFGHAFRGPAILVPENKHYSLLKAISILGFGENALWPLALDDHGRTDIADLERQLTRARSERRPVLMVVSVAGTTELGTIDRIDEIRAVLDRWRDEHGIHIWHHVDAAYGGYLATVPEKHRVLAKHAEHALLAMPLAESISLDPHKLGYVPYSAGVFLTRTERDYRIKSFDAPYIHYIEPSDHGPFTIEGSRNATGASATWLCSRVIGNSSDGYGAILAGTIAAKNDLARALARTDPRIRLAPGADSNVLCFAVAEDGEPLSVTNRRTEAVYERFSPEHNAVFYVSRTVLSHKAYGRYIGAFSASWTAQVDTDELHLVRLCLLNPTFDRETEALWLAELTRALAASGTL